MLQVNPHKIVQPSIAPVNCYEPRCDSAIGQHLLTDQSCAQHYSEFDDRFAILAKGRSAFHLSALEATFVKVSQPILCRQKEFVYALKITL